MIEDTVGISPQFLMTLQYARTLYNRRYGRRPEGFEKELHTCKVKETASCNLKEFYRSL